MNWMRLTLFGWIDGKYSVWLACFCWAVFFQNEKFSIHFLFCKKSNTGLSRCSRLTILFIYLLNEYNTRIIALQSQQVCTQPIDLISIQMAVSVCVRLSVFCAISYTFCVIWWVFIFLFGMIHQANQPIHRKCFAACFSSYIFKQVPMILFKTQKFNDWIEKICFFFQIYSKNRMEVNREEK